MGGEAAILHAGSVPGDPATRPDQHLWTTGGFSLADVLAGRAPCPPAVRALVVVAWRPPALPAPEPSTVDDGGLVLARRASDFVRPRPEVARQEVTLRGAWERALAVLHPIAAYRLGPLDLAFAAGDEAETACQGLYQELSEMGGGDWRVGYARLGRCGAGAALRALELWVLDAGGDGSWLVDVTDLS